MTTRPILSITFDTETNGLGTRDSLVLNQYPYITQLSFVVFDHIHQDVVYVYNNYIRIPDGITIPEEVTKITGITEDICRNKGVDICSALGEFYIWYNKCSFAVAHNIEFDNMCISAEIARHYARFSNTYPFILGTFNPYYEKANGIQQICTMIMGKPVCNILVEGKYKDASGVPKKYVKPPKLTELYEFLFDSSPIGLHNSLIDTLACLRCFLKVKFNYILPNDVLEKYGLLSTN
jgi:DNA polymerase III epsilon subunit-like protein